MINAQQLNALPRLSPSQVSAYPQQSSFVPAVRAADTTADPMTAMMGMMIPLIMMIMVMKIMTKVTGEI